MADAGKSHFSVTPTTIQAQATVRAGHSFGPTQLTYHVTALPFTGFFPPIDNPPTTRTLFAWAPRLAS